MIDPAVNGTLNVLRSCKKTSTIKRVVVTSSSSTIRIRNDIEPEQMLDEKSWSSLDICYQFKVNVETFMANLNQSISTLHTCALSEHIKFTIQISLKIESKHS